MERLLVGVTIAVVALIAILYVVEQRKRMRFSTIEIPKYGRAGIGKVGSNWSDRGITASITNRDSSHKCTSGCRCNNPLRSEGLGQ